MATAKLQKRLLILGIVVSVAAVIWWGVVNYFLAQQTGGNMMDSVSCIYSLSASCNLMRGMVWMRGRSLYEPMVFWMGILILGIALGMKRSLAADTIGGAK